MKQIVLWIGVVLAVINVGAQTVPDTISADLVQRYLYYLASDSLKGRGDYTPELQTAATFIATQFYKDSLFVFPSFNSYFQPFTNKIVPEKDFLPDSSGQYDAEKILLNVIGVLPGKTKAEEAVLFTAHYDHLGVEPDGKWGDHIFNGANDNASGTTALLALARYYAIKNNNERTLIFCAFAGEELGLLGSELFSKQVNPDHIVAVINIEMIGRNNVAGKNVFFITGSGYSSFKDIIKTNLQGTNINIRSEPSFTKQLFKRSDNYPFVIMGIPAHTIMCSDDSDGCYHKPCDEADRIDILQMTTIINAIEGMYYYNKWN